MFWVEIVPAGLFLIALFFIPESPRFLVSAGRDDQALRVLERVLPGEGRAKLAEIKASLNTGHRPRLRDVFDAAGRLHPVVWVGIGLAVLQQAVGINVVFYYGSVLWQSAGFTENHALLINVVSGALSIGACLLATWQVDRLGRRPLLLAGSIGMAVTLGLVALVFTGAEVGAGGQLVLSGREGVVALVAANLYVMVFNATWGPVVWILLGEMFPNRFRGSALGLAGFGMWVANFGVTMSFPTFLTGIGLGGAYGIYTAFALLSVGFTWLWVRETKGRELEAMAER
jgi:sugar porter (SP) family MFS transporter